jgi:hypothetical protein
MEMTVNNFLAIWLCLNAIAVILGMLRSDYWKIQKDTLLICKNKSLLYKIIIGGSLFMLLPFTIGESLINIKNRLKK